MPDPRTDRQEEFIDALQQLLSRFSDVVGPVVPDDDPENGVAYTAQELSEMPMVKNAVLVEWMVLTAWTCLDDNESYTSAFTMPNMPTHHRIGLLQTWVTTWS